MKRDTTTKLRNDGTTKEREARQPRGAPAAGAPGYGGGGSAPDLGASVRPLASGREEAARTGHGTTSSATSEGGGPSTSTGTGGASGGMNSGVAGVAGSALPPPRRRKPQPRSPRT